MGHLIEEVAVSTLKEYALISEIRVNVKLAGKGGLQIFPDVLPSPSDGLEIEESMLSIAAYNLLHLIIAWDIFVLHQVMAKNILQSFYLRHIIASFSGFH